MSFVSKIQASLDLAFLHTVTIRGERLADIERWVPCPISQKGGKGGIKGYADPKNWKTLDKIGAGADVLPGFMLTGSSFFVLDGDHVFREGSPGEVREEVKERYEDFLSAFREVTGGAHTYGEYSQSGTGFHLLLCLDDVTTPLVKVNSQLYLTDAGKNDPGKIEGFFQVGRKVNLTGNSMNGCTEVLTGDAALAVYEMFNEKYFVQETSKKPPRKAFGASKFLHSTDDVQDALFAIDADCEYSTWISILKAARGSGIPFEVFDEWSSTGATKYSGTDETRKKWSSFEGKKNGATEKTIYKFALEAGWKPPAKKGTGTNGEQKGRENDAPSPSGLLVCVADIAEEKAEWLVPGYIPQKQITVLCGDGGVGKSTIACAIAASVTTGKPSFMIVIMPGQPQLSSVVY